MTHSHVAVTPGDGVLVRRSTAVLFDPTGQNDQLVATFDGARDDVAAIRGVKEQVILSGFASMPFVLLSWGSRVDLLTFGDCPVRSTAPSAPMINGADSTTWVQHCIEPQDLARLGKMTIRCGEDADPVTNLRLGAAKCSGIAVTLTAAQVPAFRRTEPKPATTSTDTVVRLVAPLPTPDLPRVPAADPEDVDLISVAGPTPAVTAVTPYSKTDLLAAPRHRATSAVSATNEPDAAPDPGHQHGIGEIVFPQGTSVPVDRPIRLGRRPQDPGDGTLAITIHADDMAADHATIAIDGWATVLIDLDSEIGTFVMSPQAHTFVQLRPHKAHVLESGTTVRFGQSAASFQYRVQQA